MRFNFDQLLFTLSDIVDLTGIADIQHSKRIACMAWKCSKTLGYDSERQKKLLHLGLLHHCGISSTKMQSQLINEFDWKNSYNHCQTAEKRLNSFKYFKHLGNTILYHHSPWETLKELDIPRETKYDANLLYLLDRVNYLGLTTPGPTWISKKNVIRNKINRFKGSYFQEELVDGFLRCSEREAFWFALEPLVLIDFMEQRKTNQGKKNISFKQFRAFSELVAQIVDAKNPFTADHSTGVARLSGQLAVFAGLDKDVCEQVEVAGLLHDIGKLQVPDSVLEQPGALSGEGLSQMRQHSYAGYRILKKIEGIEDIASWTANHHEALDGSGYPYRRTAEELDTGSRILAISDTFQALTQDRPYRVAKTMEEIIAFLQGNFQRHRLDTQLVEIVADNLEQCYQTATEG